MITLYMIKRKGDNVLIMFTTLKKTWNWINSWKIYNRICCKFEVWSSEPSSGFALWSYTTRDCAIMSHKLKAENPLTAEHDLSLCAMILKQVVTETLVPTSSADNAV